MRLKRLVIIVLCILSAWFLVTNIPYGIRVYYHVYNPRLRLPLLFFDVIILIGSIIFLIKTKGPSDAEIEAAIASQLKNLKARAMKKLAIDETEVSEIAPIAFSGYVYDNALIKKGKDGKYRSNKYQAVMFFFSDNELYCFTYNFSLTESGERESTDVYFYKDIVSVSTQTDGTALSKLKSSRFNRESFMLTTVGGTQICCSVIDLEGAQRSINGMRSLIKSKKTE